MKSGPAFSGIWPQEIRFFPKDLSLLSPISPKNLEFPAGQVASWSSSYPGCGIYACMGPGGILGRIGKQIVALKPRDLVLVPSGAPVCWFAERNDSNLLAVHFIPAIMTVDMNARELTAFCSSFWFGREGQVRVQSLGRETHDFIRTRLQGMLEDQRTGSGERGLRWKVFLGEILLEILRGGPPGRLPVASLETDQDWQRLPKVLDYLHKNCREELYAEKILKDLNLPGDFLATSFPGIMGQRWSRYLLDYRIRLAAGLLRQRNAPISFVAQECGFGTLSHFNASFRKTMGMAPREFYKKSATGVASKGDRGQTGAVNSKGFTLVELLVTISIIGLLAGLAIPGIKAARENSSRTQCLSNIRQLTAAQLAAAADEGGRVFVRDDNRNWAHDTGGNITNGYLWAGGYIQNPKVFLCPHGRQPIARWFGNTNCHYSINTTPEDLTTTNRMVIINRLPGASRVIMLLEEAVVNAAFRQDSCAALDFNKSPLASDRLFTDETGISNHRKRGNVSFYDGSAVSMSKTEWQTMLNTQNKRRLAYGTP